MPRKSNSIPVNYFGDENDSGISIEKVSAGDFEIARESEESHRHDRHSFFLVENGTVSIEIDFERYFFKSPAVIYMHPNQVHRILDFEDVQVTSWALNNESLNPEYLKLLEDISPTKPLVLSDETFSVMSQATFLSLKLADRRNDRLYYSFLKDSCNALVALVISQYLEQTKPADKLSRSEIITKAFHDTLEHNYLAAKRPAEYAEKLNISAPYLNECLKSTTGLSVSHHIQQRVILEAKRLLFYSSKSVKEIAAELGYDDYPYFSRLFTKVAGMSALAFRNKNLD